MKEIKINTVKIEIDVNKLIGSPSKLINVISGEHNEIFLKGYNAYITRNEKGQNSIDLSNPDYQKGYDAARALFNAGEIFAIKKRADYNYIVKVLKDGNAYCCVGTEFTDLQSSDDYAFGYSIYKAISNYAKIKQAQLNLRNTIAEVDKSNSVNEVKEPELKELSPEELKNISVKITNVAPKEIIKFFDNNSLIEENKELNSKLNTCYGVIDEYAKETNLKSNKLNELNSKLIELFTENKNLTLKIQNADKWISTLIFQVQDIKSKNTQLYEENKQLKNDYVSVCQSNEQKTLALEEFKAKVESSKIELYARPPIWSSPNLPKISEQTLEKLAFIYSDSKKTANTFDSWLVASVEAAETEVNKNNSLPKIPDNIIGELVKIYVARNNGDDFCGWLLHCAKEANKVKPAHPIDPDTLSYLKNYYQDYLNEATKLAHGNLTSYLKESCKNFNKLEKIKAIL